jgi:predicted NBD/HSP70 family sugar kinase
VEQRHYVGLDVSLDLTSICVVDEAGAIVWRGKCASEPDAIGHAIRAMRLRPFASAWRLASCRIG